jgi:hypothetical protein
MKYEFKKLFSSRLMWVALLITVGYMFLLPIREIYGNIGTNRITASNVKKVIEDTKKQGIPRDSVADYLRQKKAGIEPYIYGDGTQYEAVYGETAMEDFIAVASAADIAAYVYEDFPADRTATVNNMIYNSVSENKKDSPDMYTIRVNQKAVRQYNRAISLEFESTGIYSTTQYDIFNYSLWEFVMIAFCVTATVRMFSLDYSSGSFRLINTSKRTLKNLYAKQLLSVLSVMTAILLLQGIFELVTDIYVFGAGHFNLPIQQITEFEMCPYQITIAEFFIVKLLIKLLAYTFMISVTGMVTILLRKPLISNIVGILICGGGLLLNMIFYIALDKSEGNVQKILKIYNRIRTAIPQSMINSREYLSRFDRFNLFGFPVDRLAFCSILTVAVSTLCIFIGYKKCGRKEV